MENDIGKIGWKWGATIGGTITVFRNILVKLSGMMVFTFLLCITGAAANAEKRTLIKKAKTGIPSFIASIRTFNDRTCEHLQSNIDVISPPKFGTIVVKIGKPKKITTTSTKRKTCLGRYLKGLEIIYTSAKNFKGWDSLRVQISYPGRSSKWNSYYTYKIRVN